MDIAFKFLFRKLNAFTKGSLEAALNSCRAKKLGTVELESWLIELLVDKRSTISLLLKSFSIEPAEIVQKIPQYNAALSQTDRPEISRTIYALIRNSWLLASAELNATSLHSGHLLLALVADPVSYSLSIDLKKLLSKVSLAEAKANLNTAWQNSAEATSEASDVPEVVANSALGLFTTDLVDLAKKNLLDRAIGRKAELNQVIDVLCRRKQNNPVLVGEAGVGKTAIVEELAFLIAENSIPDILEGSSLRVLDMAALQAGARVKGEFEERLKNIINEIKQAKQKVILFIDEVHNIIGAGSGGSGHNDAANLLKPELARGEIRVIGATTWGEYKKYFEKDAALNRRFQLIKVKEPSEVEAVAILRNVATLLEKHHGVQILDQAIGLAVKLSVRYMTNSYLPDKVVSLLDSACARVKLQHTLPPVVLQKAEEEISLLAQHIKRLEAEIIDETDNKASLRGELAEKKVRLEDKYQKDYTAWQESLNAVQDLRRLRSSLKKDDYTNKLKELNLHTSSETAVHECVDESVVASILSAWTGIPIDVGDLNKGDIASLLTLEDKIQLRVVGQDHAIRKIVQNIRMARANIADPRKPIGVFLLVGESGVGKTETALSLAGAMYGDERKVITINMSEYKEAHKISSLIGSPPGYVGYGEGGKLTEAVRRSPYSVILLDEMEKAHSDVQELFLQVFDKGSLTDSEGVEVNFKNTIIIMTSNFAANKIREFAELKGQDDDQDSNNVQKSTGNDLGSQDSLDDQGDRGDQESKESNLDDTGDDQSQLDTKDNSIDDLTNYLVEALIGKFKPEFLGRVTIIPYLPLDDEMLRSIIILQFSKIAERIEHNYRAKFSYADEVIAKIIKDCKTSELGARQIEQIISRDILPELAINLLEAAATNKTFMVVNLSMRDGKLNFSLKP